MKLKFIIAATLFISQLTYAGDKIGNGGGLWACQNTLQQIDSAILVDLFEAQIEFTLTLSPAMPGLAAQQLAIQKSQALKSVNVSYSQKLEKYLTEVFQKIQFVNAVLEKVDDALYRTKPLPSTCPTGRWQYLQFANFTYQNQVLIRNDVWTSPAVSELDKAALLIHEAVYRWLRNEYADTNSVRSRQIVGLLFSTLPPDEIDRRIQVLLGPSNQPGVLDSWACLLTEENQSSKYIGYGQTEIEARNNAAVNCSQKTTPFFCNRAVSTCEKAETNALVWYCSVTNENSSQQFSGQGRTKTEASYEALNSCQNQSHSGGFFCKSPICSSRQ